MRSSDCEMAEEFNRAEHAEGAEKWKIENVELKMKNENSLSVLSDLCG